MPRFRATIDAADRGGALVAVPDDIVATLGGGGRIPVQATFDDIAYQGSVVSMGGRMVIGIRKDIRSAIGKQPGDEISVTLERDTATRTVAVPDDLRSALNSAGLDRAFDALSLSHRREYVQWVDEAKKPETRARRIAGTLEKLGS
jgi:hypothetical protein